MKHIKPIFLSSLGLLTIPMTVIPTSCSNKTAIEPTVVQKAQAHFQTNVEVSKIYQNEQFTISFTLNENCGVDESSSYVRCGYNHSHAFNGQHITSSKSGNTYTYTVNKNIVEGNFVNIYIATYKYFAFDTSSSTSDFQFIDVLTPTPVENERFTIGFKVLNDKGLDLNKSTITVGSTQLSIGQYFAYESDYNDTTYTFLQIPSKYVTDNIKLSLVAGESVQVKAKTYPEYKLQYLSNPVKTNAFYCYFEIADSDKYELDTANAIIKVGSTQLTTEQYTFVDSYLKINQDVITDDVTIDVPVKEYFNVYSCDYYEYPTVLAVGEKFNKSQEYSFLVYPLNSKEILWDDANSYLTINGTQLKSTEFTYAKDTETGAWKITLTAAQTLGDVYCHFVTQ